MPTVSSRIAIAAAIMLSGCATARRDIGRVENPIGPGTTSITPALNARSGIAPTTYASQPQPGIVPNVMAAPVNPPIAVPSLAAAQPIGQPGGSCCTPQVVAGPTGAPQSVPSGSVYPGHAYPSPMSPAGPTAAVPYAAAPVPQVPMIAATSPLAFVGPGTGSSFVPAIGGPAGVAVAVPNNAGPAAPFGTGPITAVPGMAGVAQVSGFLSETNFATRGLKLHPTMPGEMVASPVPAPTNSDVPRRPLVEPPISRPQRELPREGTLRTPPPPDESARQPERRQPPAGRGEEFTPPASKPDSGPNLRSIPRKKDEEIPLPKGRMPDDQPYPAPSKRDIGVPKNPRDRGP